MGIRTSWFGKLLYTKSQQQCITTIWRCLSHRLQLAVRHCIADMNDINHVKSSTDTTQASFGESSKEI